MLKKLPLAFGLFLGAYLIVRAAVEPFVIDMTDSSTYHLDWGGPHLVGVLAVHCGPGIVSAVLIARWLRRRRLPAARPGLEDSAATRR
jgi:hypothetical protein